MSESNALKKHVYKVQMKCKNCIKNIENALDPLRGKGIEEYNLKFEEQIVEVTTTLPPEEILNIIKSIGKEASLVSST